MSDKFVIGDADGYQLTKDGLEFVTQLLEEGGYFEDFDMAGFEADTVWAGIMATHMVEAASRYLKEKAKIQDGLDDDEMSLIALVGLYLTVAEQQAMDSLPSGAGAGHEL